MVFGSVLGACDQQPAGGADPTKGSNAERYARDKQACESQAYDTTKERRRVDDSRRDVFDDTQDRFGRSGLPDTMAVYGDAKNSDRLVERCLAARGWAAPPKAWWQKITG
jgi:hypothetical protein